jgi:AcrR family transcriptional regulator
MSATSPPAFTTLGNEKTERESAICVAALELLAEVGYDRMTMDGVAARARASKATIYRRWPGKRELVQDAIRFRTDHRMDVPDTGTLRGDIIATLRVMSTKFGQRDLDLMAGVMRAMRNAPDLAQCVRAQTLEAKRYVGNTIVARAIDRGELPAGTDPEPFHETAPAIMFFRILIVDLPVDEPFLAHVADDILVPLLTATGRRSNIQETT